MAARPLLYLIDGSSQMYRAFHAPIRTQEGTPLRDSQGRPTNAVYIFITMLRKLLKEHAPQFIAASFDLPGRTFRDDLAADYKANRAPMPDDLAVQIPLVHRACEALGVPILTQERYEADDVIGTMTVRAASEGYDVAIRIARDLPPAIENELGLPLAVQIERAVQNAGESQTARCG